MPKYEEEAKLTHSSDEFDLDTIFASDCIFSIPYFQREYIWSKTQLKQLRTDLLELVDEEEDITFLGAIILYSRQVPAGRSKTYEVVDGQQRLTTITLFFLCLVQQFCNLEQYEEAAQLFERYVFLGKSRKELSNLKLHPCKQDRLQFNSIVESLLTDEDLFNELGKPEILYLPGTGNTQGNITTQFIEIKKFLEEEVEEGGYQRLDDIYQALLKKLTIVQIILKDPYACPRIFERLNYRGQKVSIGDLVRNEIFSKVVNIDVVKLDQIYHKTWEPFYKKFGGAKAFEGFFFPFGLIKKSSLKKSEVFNYLRGAWNKTSNPEKIISDLKVYQDAYLFLLGKITDIELSKKVRKIILKLVHAKVPSSTFPFLMQVMHSCQSGKLDEAATLQIFSVIDSFLTRRAVVGYEPTGLHAVFKGLFEECGKRPTKETVIANIKKHKTVPWPGNEEFARAIKERSIYTSGIASYLIREYDMSLGKDVPSDKPEIEHILPQRLTPEWKVDFSQDQHNKLKDTWANLIPVSSPLNKHVRQKKFEIKQQTYKTDSMYATPRHVAQTYKTWNPTSISKRAAELQKWSLERWPY